MKKTLSLVLAVMMLLGCFSITAFAEETVTLHYYFDTNALDYFVNSARTDYDSFVQDMQDIPEDMRPDRVNDYKESHPGYIDDNGEFLTDAVKQILMDEFSAPESIWSLDWLTYYYFTPNGEKNGWYDVEVPVGMNFQKSTLRTKNHMFNLGIYGNNTPARTESEMWLVLTLNAGQDGFVNEFYNTAPSFWNTAPAGPSDSTDIILTVAKDLSYEMVIPSDVTNLDAAGIYPVGQAKVANVKNATDNTVISYTAETSDFTSEGKTNIPASYYTDEAGQNAFPTTAVEVYKAKADAASIPTMYVGISETDWNAAENGTYTATVTFNFEAEEEATSSVSAADALTTGARYKLDLKVGVNYSFIYEKTTDKFEVVTIFTNTDDTTDTIKQACSSNVDGTNIVFIFGGGSLTVTLNTSTGTYSFGGTYFNLAEFISFSVKPVGATEFTEITLTKAD